MTESPRPPEKEVSQKLTRPNFSLIIFSFLLRMCNRYIFKKNTTVCVPHIIEQTQSLSSRFLGSKFKSENIYFGVHFCGKNVCGNFYLQELIFADRWKNRKN